MLEKKKFKIRRAFKKFAESAIIFLFCKSAELNYYSYIDKHDLLLIQQILLLWHEYNVYSGCYGNRTSRLPAQFCSRCLLMTLHLVVYRAIFTKLCMSKVQYVCGEHLTSYKCVTSFGRKAAILFSGYA